MAYLCVDDFLNFFVSIPVLTTPEYYPTAWTFQNFSEKKKHLKIITGISKKFMHMIIIELLVNIMSILEIRLQIYESLPPW